MGRRKIEIQAISNERNRSVTFLKRKNGLFKKAYELGVLCSVDIAVIVFEHKPGHNSKLFEYCSTDTRQLLSRWTKFSGERESKSTGDFDGTGPAEPADEDDAEDEEIPMEDNEPGPSKAAETSRANVPDVPPAPAYTVAALDGAQQGSGSASGKPSNKKRRLEPAALRDGFLRAFDAALDPNSEHPPLPPYNPLHSIPTGSIPLNAMPPGHNQGASSQTNGSGGAGFQRWQPGGNPATYNYGVGQRDPSTDILDFDWPDAIASHRERPPPPPPTHPFAPELVPAHTVPTNSTSYGSGFATTSRNGGTSDDWLDFVATMAPPSQPPPHVNGNASAGRSVPISMSRGSGFNHARRSVSPVGNASMQIASVRRGASGGSAAQRPRRRSASSMSSISGQESQHGNANVEIG